MKFEISKDVIRLVVAAGLTFTLVSSCAKLVIHDRDTDLKIKQIEARK